MILSTGLVNHVPLLVTPRVTLSVLMCRAWAAVFLSPVGWCVIVLAALSVPFWISALSDTRLALHLTYLLTDGG